MNLYSKIYDEVKNMSTIKDIFEYLETKSKCIIDDDQIYTIKIKGGWTINREVSYNGIDIIYKSNKFILLENDFPVLINAILREHPINLIYMFITKYAKKQYIEKFENSVIENSKFKYTLDFLSDDEYNIIADRSGKYVFKIQIKYGIVKYIDVRGFGVDMDLNKMEEESILKQIIRNYKLKKILK